MNYQQFSKLSTEEQTRVYNSLSVREKAMINLEAFKTNGVNELGEEEKEFAAMIGQTEEDFVKEYIARLESKLK